MTTDRVFYVAGYDQKRGMWFQFTENEATARVLHDEGERVGLSPFVDTYNGPGDSPLPILPRDDAERSEVLWQKLLQSGQEP